MPCLTARSFSRHGVDQSHPCTIEGLNLWDILCLRLRYAPKWATTIHQGAVVWMCCLFSILKNFIHVVPSECLSPRECPNSWAKTLEFRFVEVFTQRSLDQWLGKCRESPPQEQVQNSRIRMILRSYGHLQHGTYSTERKHGQKPFSPQNCLKTFHCHSDQNVGCYKNIKINPKGPRADSARAVTGRRCPRF